jgi:hypothetical protein
MEFPYITSDLILIWLGHLFWVAKTEISTPCQEIMYATERMYSQIKAGVGIPGKSSSFSVIN